MKPLLVCSLVSLAAGPAYSAEPLEEALAALSAERIEAHMAFLADDLLEGRETGTRGYDLAAAYVATQLTGFGVEPAGNDGTFFQTIPFRRAVQVPERCTVVLTGEAGDRPQVYAKDFLTRPNFVHRDAEVEADLVFVGFGVSAPELGYDDYAGIDAEGKIAVMFRGGPPGFRPDQRAHFASGSLKRAAAVRAGVVGTITMWSPEDMARRSWDRAVRNSSIARMRALDPDSRPVDVSPELRLGLFLSPAGAEAVFSAAGRSLEEVFGILASGRTQSFDLETGIRAVARSSYSEVRSANVVGVMPGSHPERAAEYVVFSGHLDHLGKAEDSEGDRIYNGAIDNASGIAVMLEVARVLGGMPRRPERSILFLAVTGEEKGLLGSEYFVAHPTVPMGNVVANVNLDMFLMIHPLHDVVAFGAEHSTLGGLVEREAEGMGLRLSPDPMPSEVIFVRSDQYSFVRQGVPAVFLVAGEDAGDGTDRGAELHKAWMKDTYHSRSDEMNDELDFEAALTFARLNLRIGYALAQDPGRPTWLPGDFFGDLYGTETTRGVPE